MPQPAAGTGWARPRRSCYPPDAVSLEASTLQPALAGLVTDIVLAIAPILGVLIAAAIIANVGQWLCHTLICNVSIVSLHVQRYSTSHHCNVPLASISDSPRRLSLY